MRADPPAASDAAMALLGIVGCALVALSYAAPWWWVAELVASLRVPLALGGLGLTLAMVARRRWRWAGATLVAAALAALPVGLSLVPEGAPPSPDGPTMRLLLANLLRANATPAGLMDQVAAFDPDVVAVLELSSPGRQALVRLEGSHPLVLSEVHDADNFGIGLYSRVPLREGKVVHRMGPWASVGVPGITATLQVQGAAPVALFVGHPVPPVSAAATAHRDQHLRRLAGAASRTRGPTILLGDLNAASWSPALRAVERGAGLRSARRGRRALGGTWPAALPGLLRLPIDHALVSPDVRVESLQVGPAYGSDHRAIWLTVTLPAE